MKKLNTLIVMVVAAAFANAGTIEQLAATPAATAIVDVTTEYSSEKVWRGSDIGQNEAVATVTTDTEVALTIPSGIDLSKT